MEPEPHLTEPWTPKERAPTLFRRAADSDRFGWVLLALKVLLVFAILFAIVLVILYFTEGPDTEGLPIP